jgi:class 3 adenylate cyclase
MLSARTRYAKSGGVHIAYQVVGHGPIDLVWIPSLAHHVELNWENPSVARYLTRLAELTRLIVFDKRGTGMSDRVCTDATLETRMDDVRAVLAAADSERAVICGIGDGGPLAALFAATYPERTAGLVLVNSTPRFVRSGGFTWLPARADHEQYIEDLVAHWSDPTTQDRLLLVASPDMSADDLQPFGRLLRLSVSPGALGQYLSMNLDVDISGVLASIRVPTLVLHRSGVPTMDIRGGRYLAAHIPGARLVELEGRNLAPGVGNVGAVLDELERFLEDVIRLGGEPREDAERVLTTVLFTDIVGSTERASAVGDRAWRDQLLRHHEVVRRELTRFRGTEFDTAGDGFFASFDGPARAIRCARAIVAGVAELGIEVRAGLHTGECELVDDKLAGIAVHIGARVAACASPNEVLGSSTVKDLVAGSGIDFVDRGMTELKGIAGKWGLFAVDPASLGHAESQFARREAVSASS